MALIGSRTKANLGLALQDKPLGIAQGEYGITPTADMGGLMGTPAVAAPKQGVDWAGVIADALAGAAGQPLPYASMRNQQWQADREDQRYERRRQQQLQDQKATHAQTLQDALALYDYKRAHPETPDVPAAQRMIEWTASLPENDPRRALAMRALPGAAYNLDLQQPLLDARAAANAAAAMARANLALRNKQAPTYAQTHPKPKTGGGGGRNDDLSYLRGN